MIERSYNPFRVSPPGDTLADILEERGISQRQLAVRMGRSEKHINLVINGKASLSSEFALELESVLGTSARFWLNREAAYQEWMARSAVIEPKASDLRWATLFPYSKMEQLGWIEAASPGKERFSNLVRYFGVTGVESFNEYWTAPKSLVQFRSSRIDPKKLHLIATWLRRGEVESEGISIESYSESRFRASIAEIPRMTLLSPKEFCPLLRELFASAGVMILFVPELPGLGVSGAVRWLTSDRALIQITLRFKTNDQFWFTVLHECCHVLRHAKKGILLEMGRSLEEEEIEANEFARDALIPPKEFERFVSQGSFTASAIREFSSRIGVAAGIVVGRLQHEKFVPYNSLNGLKQKFRWVKNTD